MRSLTDPGITFLDDGEAPPARGQPTPAGNFEATVTLTEGAPSTYPRKPARLATMVMRALMDRPGLPVGKFGATARAACTLEISDCLRLHMSGMTWPPMHEYMITLKREGDYVTASVVSQSVGKEVRK